MRAAAYDEHGKASVLTLRDAEALPRRKGDRGRAAAGQRALDRLEIRISVRERREVDWLRREPRQHVRAQALEGVAAGARSGGDRDK